MKNINELCKVLCKRTVPPTFPFQEEVTCSITLGVVVAVNNQLVAFWELPSVIESHLVHGHILSQRQSASNDWLTSVIMAGLFASDWDKSEGFPHHQLPMGSSVSFVTTLAFNFPLCAVSIP
jgi:hypothetical protein